jgi:hypothetical protein
MRMRTYVPMKADPHPNRNGPLVGRLVLFASAYAPAALIVGFRILPEAGGLVAIGLGAFGLLVWSLFLAYMPHAQEHQVDLVDLEAVDNEVTGYIVSYLLPILAAGSPSCGDLVAYGICAALILIVAFAADLGSVNPLIYLFGLRVGRGVIDGEAVIILAKRLSDVGTEPTVTQKLGVIVVVKTTEQTVPSATQTGAD